MLISQFAEHTGVPATTLRYYESAGLVPAERTDSGYRIYGERDVDRVAFIQAAKHVGLPLGEIRELLAVWGARSLRRGPCAATPENGRTPGRGHHADRGAHRVHRHPSSGAGPTRRSA